MSKKNGYIRPVSLSLDERVVLRWLASNYFDHNPMAVDDHKDLIYRLDFLYPVDFVPSFEPSFELDFSYLGKKL